LFFSSRREEQEQKVLPDHNILFFARVSSSGKLPGSPGRALLLQQISKEEPCPP